MNNTAYFMHRKDAAFIAFIIGLDICDVKYSDFGFWVNVKWPCGETAPLTTRECELIGYPKQPQPS